MNHEPPTNDAANEPLVLAAAGVTVLLWASAFLVIRVVGPHYDPGAMALLRLIIATAALGLIAARTGIRWPTRRALPVVALWGIGWFCLYNLALNTAERVVDAGTAAMIVNIAPLLVVVLGGLVLGEGFPRGLVIGAPLSFAGVVLIGLQNGGRGSLLGLGLSLLAALLYAAATLIQKRMIGSYDVRSMTFVGSLAATIALLPWTLPLVHDITHAPPAATAGVVYLGVFPSAVAFTTWGYVLGRTSAGTTSATTYVVPALTIVLSWLFLGEAPTLLVLIGGALCLVGVAVTRLAGGQRRGAGR